MKEKISLFLLSFVFFSEGYAKCFVQIATYRVRAFAVSFSEKLEKELGLKTVLKPYENFYVLETEDFDNYDKCFRIKRSLEKQFGIRTLVKQRVSTNHKKGLEAVPKQRESGKRDLVAIYLQRAKVCMGKRQCGKAVNYLKLAIKKNPNNPKLFVYLGYAYMNLKNYSLSEQAFKKAISIDPSFPEGFAGIGILYLKEKKYLAAELALKRAYELKPREISYALNYAIALMLAKKYNEAEEILERLEEIYPIYPEISYNLGLLFLKQGKLREAKLEFQKFLALTSGTKFYEKYRIQVKNVLKQIEK